MRKKRTPERWQEIWAWRQENNATGAATEEHFGLPEGAYFSWAQAASQRGWPNTPGDKLVAKRSYTPRKTQAPIDIELNTRPKADPKVAIFVMPLSQVKDLLGELWP